MIQFQENKVVIQLGYGDVSIETAEHDDGKQYLVIVGDGPAGEDSTPKPVVVIESTSPESIDVLISKLFRLRGIVVPVYFGDPNVTVIDTTIDTNYSAASSSCSNPDRIY